jgi:hypothetical protein
MCHFSLLSVRYELPIVLEDEVETVSIIQEAVLEAPLPTISQTAGVTSTVFPLISTKA